MNPGGTGGCGRYNRDREKRRWGRPSAVGEPIGARVAGHPLIATLTPGRPRWGSGGARGERERSRRPAGTVQLIVSEIGALCREVP